MRLVRSLSSLAFILIISPRFSLAFSLIISLNMFHSATPEGGAPRELVSTRFILCSFFSYCYDTTSLLQETVIVLNDSECLVLSSFDGDENVRKQRT